jgi:hypothetical protein
VLNGPRSTHTSVCTGLREDLFMFVGYITLVHGVVPVGRSSYILFVLIRNAADKKTPQLIVVLHSLIRYHAPHSPTGDPGASRNSKSRHVFPCAKVGKLTSKAGAIAWGCHGLVAYGCSSSVVVVDSSTVETVQTLDGHAAPVSAVCWYFFFCLVYLPNGETNLLPFDHVGHGIASIQRPLTKTICALSPETPLERFSCGMLWAVIALCGLPVCCLESE